MKIGIPAMLVLALCTGCSRESRSLGPDLPQTPPTNDADQRASRFEGNIYQVAQGGRYFAWSGCGGCHGHDATGRLSLADDRWEHGSGVAAVYRSIADRHGRLDYGRRLTPEQLWQVTAYVRSLPTLPPYRRRRQDMDLAGEPEGSQWSGALQ
jgi:cytochrome c oxidase cbb3-type subunit III